jgi:hypothetical protein
MGTLQKLHELSNACRSKFISFRGDPHFANYHCTLRAQMPNDTRRTERYLRRNNGVVDRADRNQVLNCAEVGELANPDFITPFKTRIGIDWICPNKTNDPIVFANESLALDDVAGRESWLRTFASDVVGKRRQGTPVAVMSFNPSIVFCYDVVHAVL